MKKKKMELLKKCAVIASSFDFKRPPFRVIPLFVALIAYSSHSIGEGYGIYDARALAMGGTTIAISTTDHAQFYNPALLSFHDGREDRTRDGRLYFPLISTNISDSVNDLIEIENDDLVGGLTNSINGFNLDQSRANANAVLAGTERLLDAANRIDGQDISLGGFYGLSISEPSDREGGAFYIGARAIGGGVPDVTDSDRELLGDYVEALEFYASGGTRGEEHPELFIAGGSLADPTVNLTSSAAGQGAAIIEFGISLSKEFQIFNRPIALGVTPKLMKVRTFEIQQDLSGGDIDTESDDSGHLTFNADIGIASEITEKVRIGFAVKDVESKNFKTVLGNSVRIKPKPRMGVGYVNGGFQLGFDYDLAPSEPVSNESALQELSLGSEWKLTDPIALRLGYRHDLEGSRADILSVGAGLKFYSMLVDLTYAAGGDSEAFAAQFGYAF